MSTATIDENKLNAFIGRAVGDIGAAMSAALVLIGDELGLYKAMASAGPITPGELAKRTETTERYVREWLNNQAAGGYVSYDAAGGRYTLPPEQALALADETSPAFLPGAFQLIAAAMRAEPRIAQAFRSGGGLDWGDHDPILYVGVERFFRSGYLGNLVSAWLPALDGVEAKLKRGARVVDVGCGHGASTILMARSYPTSQFLGVDSHAASIETARRRARDAGVADRVRFEVASAQDFAGNGYDLVTCFDCLHDMADPVGAARHIRRRWPRTAPGCWSSRSRPTGSRTITTRSGACSTARRRCSACRVRWPATDRRWARRRARRGCATWSSTKAASPASAARPRHPSTWCWKPARKVGP